MMMKIGPNPRSSVAGQAECRVGGARLRAEVSGQKQCPGKSGYRPEAQGGISVLPLLAGMTLIKPFKL